MELEFSPIPPVRGLSLEDTKATTNDSRIERVRSVCDELVEDAPIYVNLRPSKSLSRLSDILHTDQPTNHIIKRDDDDGNTREVESGANVARLSLGVDSLKNLIAATQDDSQKQLGNMSKEINYLTVEMADLRADCNALRLELAELKETSRGEEEGKMET